MTKWNRQLTLTAAFVAGLLLYPAMFLLHLLILKSIVGKMAISLFALSLPTLALILAKKLSRSHLIAWTMLSFAPLAFIWGCGLILFTRFFPSDMGQRLVDYVVISTFLADVIIIAGLQLNSRQPSTIRKANR